jgi:hypothetical protein
LKEVRARELGGCFASKKFTVENWFDLGKIEDPVRS